MQLKRIKEDLQSENIERENMATFTLIIELIVKY